MNIQTTKLELIKLISDTQSTQLLADIRQLFKQTEKKGKSVDSKKTSPPLPAKKTAPKFQTALAAQNNIHALAAQPLEKIDIQQLKNEQNYQPEKAKDLRGQWFQEDDYFELLKLLN